MELPSSDATTPSKASPTQQSTRTTLASTSSSTEASTSDILPPSAIPLTTYFVPGPSCANRYWAQSSVGIGSTTIISSGDPDRLYSSCMPSFAMTYSPGVCPSPMVVMNVYAIDAYRFVEVCCQRYVVRYQTSGFRKTGDGQKFPGMPGLMVRRSGFTYKLQACTRKITTSTQVLDGTLVSHTDVFTHVTTGSAVHDPFTVLWGYGDLTLFPPDASARRESILAVGVRQVATTMPGGGGNSRNGGLSPATIASIVTGVALAITLVILIVWCVLHRKSRRVLVAEHATEMDGVHTATWKRWYRGAWRAEIDSRNVQPELEGENMRTELDGGNLANEPRTQGESGNARKERPEDVSGAPDATSTVKQR
ncbi:hypothetical protein PG984_000116 [Apiospora sp. TS-2023a]